MTARRATQAQLDIMRALSEGHPPLTGAHGRSQHAGRSQSLYSMVSRGWVEVVDGEWVLTQQGLQVLREAA